MLSLFVLALAQAAPSAAPAAPPSPAFVAPGFERVPTEAEAAAAYPPEAEAARLSGDVRLRCTVSYLRQLNACRVTAETPEGKGFGAAALKMAPFYRLKPTLSDGRPASGGAVIDLGVRFDPPPAEPASAAAPAGG